MNIRSFCLTLALFLGIGLACDSAQAQSAARRYAVLSLIGDSLTVVTYQPATGSHLDRNHHQSLAMPSESFDIPALRATAAAISKLDGNSKVSLMTATSPSLYVDVIGMLNALTLQLPADVLAAVKQDEVTHLIVLSKLRGEASLQARNVSVGSGKLEGLGYYVDTVKRMTRSDTGEAGVGFLAPYAYFKLTLIDVASMRVLGSESVRATQTLSAARAKDSTSPWDALTPQQKVDTLQRMIASEVARVVPKLLQASN